MKWFKNLPIKSKLISSFTTVIIFSIVMSLLAIFSITRLDNSYTQLLDFPQNRLEYLMQIESNCNAMQQASTSIVLYAADSEEVRSYWNQFGEAYDAAIDNVNNYLANNDADTVRDATVLKANNEIVLNMKKLLESYRGIAENGMETALATGDTTKTNLVFLDGATIINEASATVSELIPKASAYMSEVSQENTMVKTTSIRLILIVLVFLAIISGAMAVFVSGLIAKPISFMSAFLNQFGTKGDLELDAETAKSAQECSTLNDEIGVCARAVGALIQHLTDIEQTLSRVADGDLTIEVKTLSDRDIIGLSVSKMVASLNSMFASIRASTGQVSTGSRQIAGGAQTLAQGSTEQASVVEELSASISEIMDKTKQNAGIARKASDLSDTIRGNAEKGNVHMDHMMSAVKEINDASSQISKVIKVIDDIAFQTNILALNAAVEAARAGLHGKGFAVVAEEVRNLAAKSAEAAKDTGELIDNSIAKADLGLNIATETSASLKEIVEGINRSAEIVSEIALSSDEQADAITQINHGIDQVAQVVQQNSATAEESAAASEEMSGQSEMLANLVSQFTLKDDASYHQLQHSPNPDSHLYVGNIDEIDISIDEDDKY